MIRLDRVTVTYPGAAAPALRDVDLHVPEGELCLVVGPTGSGKSTLLRTVNGLVPHFTGGTLAGRVTVAGRDTRDHPPRELADLVGYVGQDPDAGFVADTVEDELAYAMENLGLSRDVMRRRVEDTLDVLGLADVRHRSVRALSAGGRQRVAVGAVLTAHPRVLVLDEPTSALDPPAAEEVLALLQRLVHDLGLTVLLAEHRLERVVQYADRVVVVPGGGAPLRAGPPAEILAGSPVVPPVVALGRLAGWSPLPLSVRDARRAAAPLRARLTAPDRPAAATPGETLLDARGLEARYGEVRALAGVDLALRAGEVTALMGRNGAGKSTLLAILAGLRAPDRGGVARAASVGLVPQDPGLLLYAETVVDECAEADREAGLPLGRCKETLAELDMGLDHARHPHDLSEGQQLTLALAVILSRRPRVVLLDEPTRGLDYAAKARLVRMLRARAAAGDTVLLATHDVEMAAEVADRVVVLAEGDKVADGPAYEVLTSTPAFAPQVAKVLAPLPLLTVAEVAAVAG